MTFLWSRNCHALFHSDPSFSRQVGCLVDVSLSARFQREFRFDSHNMEWSSGYYVHRSQIEKVVAVEPLTNHQKLRTSLVVLEIETIVSICLEKWCMDVYDIMPYSSDRDAEFVFLSKPCKPSRPLRPCHILYGISRLASRWERKLALRCW